jgi:hypothetical protein
MPGDSAKQVAIDVLRSARKPLHTKEITTRVIDSGRCSGLKGKTPEATIAAMLAVGSKPATSRSTSTSRRPIVRLHEIPELIRVAAPVYVKFGLRNAPDLYPSGTHIEATAVGLSRERVRRARFGLELSGVPATSPCAPSSAPPAWRFRSRRPSSGDSGARRRRRR